MFAKVRPVGNPVPRPSDTEALSLPWEGHYTALFTGSGTEALSMAVKMAIVEKPDVDVPEVIIPAYGCPDLVAAIVAQNARPVLVDFIDDVPVMDENGIAAALSSDTVAIIAVNFLGYYERLSSLAEICFDHGIVLIEDSAQCYPPASASHGRADFVILSFGRGKPINLMGGGALLVRKSRPCVIQNLRMEFPSVAVRLGFAWHTKRLIFNMLLSRYLYPVLERVQFLHVGQTLFNPLAKIRILELPPSLLSAGILACYKMSARQALYDRELDFLVEFGWVPVSTGNSDDSMPRLRYPLLAPDKNQRDKLVKELNDRGIGASSFYARILPEIVNASVLGAVSSNDFLMAKAFSERLLTLPTHEGVRAEDVDRVVSVFKRFVI